jgi:cytochrome P450
MFLLDSSTISTLLLRGGTAILGSLLVSLFLYTVESLFTCWTLRTFTPAGSGPKWLAWFRTSCRSVFQARELVDDAYQKFSKNGLAFTLPNALMKPDIMVPPAQVKDIVSPPDDILSCRKGLDDNMQADYTLLHPRIVSNQWHPLPVKALSALTPRHVDKIMEEVSCGLSAYLGVSESWHEVQVLDTMSRVVARAANRFIVGSPTCRNEEFVTAAMSFASRSVLGAMAIRVLPEFLKPIIGPLIARPNLRNYETFAKHVEPLIEQKLSGVKSSVESSSTQEKYQLPRTDDILEWHIEYAKTQSDPGELTTDMISRRLMLFNVAAVITTAAALTHLIFDLYSVPRIDELVKELRAEIRQVLEEEEGEWNMRGLNKMVKLDSAIKESMRISSFSTRVCNRKVLHPDGVTLKNGLFLPHGSTVGVPQWALHHDPAIYSDPYIYNPLRFYNQRANSHQEQDTRSLVSASPEFLAWGLGRHACPGRFFAAAEMKLILADILLNYDVHQVKIRPPPQWLGTNHIPPTCTVKVKRRVP